MYFVVEVVKYFLLINFDIFNFLLRKYCVILLIYSFKKLVNFYFKKMNKYYDYVIGINFVECFLFLLRF